MDCLRVNLVIFGGGAVGLWLLGAATRAGKSAVLIESTSLGNGQTIASQGILHSGLKYSLQGLLTASAREAREMPAVWRQHLAGRALPDLSAVDVQSQEFFLWGTDSAASRLGLFGARLGLHVTPQPVVGGDRPALLRKCTGTVYRVAEQVIAPGSLIEGLAASHRDRILHVKTDGCAFERAPSGSVTSVRLVSPDGTSTLKIIPGQVVFAAGNGNAGLRQAVGLDPGRMQRRPLHMLMARGALPAFYGHCVDGARTRVSITSACDASGRTVWQIGGQIAEEGVTLGPRALIERGQQELIDVFPAFELNATEWSTYRVDRAEGTTPSGGRPDSFRLFVENNVLTAWPTKLVLVPQLVSAILEKIRGLQPVPDRLGDIPRAWPRPAVAPPLWEATGDWMPYSSRHRAAA